MMPLAVPVFMAALAAGVPRPKFPVSWSANEVNSIDIAQGSVPGPNGEECCAPSSPKCQVQTQSQQGLHYYDGLHNQTRFDSNGQTIVTQWGDVNREMLVAPNGTCLQYCPVQGPFDPSPFWPDIGDRELIKDLGKATVDKIECQHFQWIEHILGIIKVQETNMYLKMPSDPSQEAIPVYEHDVLEPFGNPVGTEDTHWSNFKPGQPDPSLFKVTGIAQCEMSPNCGNDDRAVQRKSRRGPMQSFRSFAKFTESSANGDVSLQRPNQELRCAVDTGSVSVRLNVAHRGVNTYTVQDAKMIHQDNGVNLVCNSNTLSTEQDVHCVGYGSGGPASLFEVTVVATETSGYSASYRVIRPQDASSTVSHWPCVFTSM